MSDAALREVERELLHDPASLELRRRHAALLTRAGQEERAVAAIDLAWRLGAEDLWDELCASLDARRLQVGALTLCYVPGGPFVMGTDELDADSAPPHLVELSPFYMAERPLTIRAVREWGGLADYYRRADLEDGMLDFTLRRHHPETVAAVDHLTRTAPPPMPGRYRLPSEAQWERVFRACYLRPDGLCPYGPRRSTQPEWIADHYDSGFYDESPRRDPTGPERGKLFVVRGAPGLPDPAYSLYRDAARGDGSFSLSRRVMGRRWVQHEGGLEARVVFLPEAT